MQARRLASFLFICQLLVTSVCAKMPPQTGFFGSKYDNLKILEQIVESDKLQNVRVPATLGVSSEQVERALEDKGVALEELWAQFKSNPTEATDQINTGSCPALKAIQDAIYFVISSDYNLLTQDQKEWLEKLADRFLMVRSTGAEDTAELVNAGGNESVAYVAPTQKDVMEAIAFVIVSYFSVKSFENRIKAGDDVFKEMPALPVIIQELVGEAVGGEGNIIPRAGVMFTNEPTFTEKEPFNVTKISASLGHNEGVVANLVPTDTFYMERSDDKGAHLLFSSVIKDKAHRLVPEKKGDKYELVSKDNPRDLAMQPALSQEQLITLFNTGRAIQSFYEQAMDIEFVFMGDTLYLVQARPVKRTPANPSYIAPAAFVEDPSPIEETYKFSSIVPGSSSVILITNKEQLLIDGTIDSAEQKYKKDITQFIVVETPASANSHPAVNLASNNMSCVYMAPAEAQKLRSALDNVSDMQPLVIDTQREAIYRWNSEQILPEIKAGWYSHPISLRLSLSLKNPEKYAQPATVKKLEPEVQALLDKIKFADKKEADSSLDILKKMFMGSTNAVKAKLLRFVLKGQVHNAPYFASIIAQMQKYFKLLEPNLQVAITKPSGSLERLYPIKLFEALINQIPLEDENILGAYSLRFFGYALVSSLPGHSYQTKLNKLEITDPQFASYAQLADFGATTATEKEWIKFLLGLEGAYKKKKISSEQVAEFKHMLDTLKKFDVLTVWLETSFQQRLTTGTWLMNSLIAEFKSAEKSIQELSLRRKELQRLKDNLSLFAEPKSFDSVFRQLKEQEAYFTGSLIDEYKQSSQLGRLIALQTMIYFADGVYDKAIKVMLASSEFDDEAKAEKLHEMIKPLFKVFEAWATKLIPEHAINYYKWNQSWFIKDSLRLKDYLERVEILVINRPGREKEGRYRASELSLDSFDVRGAMLGAATDFYRHAPRTLAQVFTLLHQNLLNVLSVLSSQTNLSNLKLSKKDRELVNSLSGMRLGRPDGVSLKSSRVGIEVGRENVKFLFNVPLRQHGMTYQLILTKNKPVRLAVQLLGHNELGRWDMIKSFITVVSPLLGLKLTNLYIPYRKMTRDEAGEISFELELPEHLSIDETTEMLEAVLKFSVLISFDTVNWESVLRAALEELFPFQDIVEIEKAVLIEAMKGKYPAEIAIKILEALHHKKQYELPKQVFSALGKNFHPYDGIYYGGWLLNKGYGYETAEQAAKEAMKSSSENMQEGGLGLLSLLVSKGHAYETAEQAAKEAMKSSRWGMPEKGLELLKELISKGYAYETAEQVARKMMTSSEERTEKKGLQLLIDLIAKGHRIQTQMIKSPYSDNMGMQHSLEKRVGGVIMQQGVA